MISYLDDHSRFIPGSKIHHNPTAEHAIKLLEESIKQYGKPDQILTDRGTQFYPARGEGSLAFTEFCSGNGIRHIVASVRRPSTIGKIEAFHKAYTIEAWMYPNHKQFVNYWNYERPHQGLSYLDPADAYFKDLKRGHLALNRTIAISMLRKEACQYINRVLQGKHLRGVDKTCKYYPCHARLEDCTWCYCPFYPCNDSSTGGRLLDRQGQNVWSCEDCTWIHSTDIAERILEELLKNGEKIESIPPEKLLEIRSNLIREFESFG